MVNALRRKIISGFLVLPFAGKLIAKASTGKASHKLPGQIASRPSALIVIRIFATLLEWYKNEFKSYPSKRKLLEWAIQNGKLQLPIPKGKWLTSQVNLFSDEVLPGWRLHLHRSQGRDSYFLAIRSLDGFTYVINEDLLIYKGDVPSQVALPELYAPINEVVRHGLIPIGSDLTSKSQQKGSFLRRVAFMNTAPQECPSCFELEGGCPGGGNCAPSGQTGCGVWGTTNCTWCCYGSCSNCRLALGPYGCMNC